MLSLNAHLFPLSLTAWRALSPFSLIPPLLASFQNQETNASLKTTEKAFVSVVAPTFFGEL